MDIEGTKTSKSGEKRATKAAKEEVSSYLGLLVCLAHDNKIDELKTEINNLSSNDCTQETILILIYIAANSGATDIVKFLLGMINISNINTCCESLSEARYLAKDKGYIDIVKLLEEALSKLFEQKPRRRFGELEYEEMMKDAYQRRDADCAIYVAKSALENNKYLMGSCYKYHPLYWLLQAREYNPDHSFFDDDNPVAKLLQDTTRVYLIGEEFTGEQSTWFIEKLANCPSVLELDFYHDSSWDFITEQFSNYLAATTSLEKLEMWSVSHAWRKDKVDSEKAKYIADGLSKNTSIKEINLKGNDIGDKGVEYIIEALKANKNNVVSTIDFACNGRITDIGARLILGYVSRDDSPLVCVYLYGNNISTDLRVKIENALQEKQLSTKPAIRQTPRKP